MCKEFGRFLNGDIPVSHAYVLDLKIELNNMNKNNEIVNNFQRNIMEVKNKCASVEVHVVDKEILHIWGVWLAIIVKLWFFYVSFCWLYLESIWLIHAFISLYFCGIYCISVFCHRIAKMGNCKIWPNTIILMT